MASTENVFDPYTQTTLDNPFPAYSSLLKGKAIKHYEHNNMPYYVIGQQQHIKAVLRDVSVWSSRFGPTPIDLHTENAGLNSDAPIHTEWRRIFSSRFTPQAMAKHQQLVSQLANTLIDEMLKTPQADLHDDFTVPLVVQVMSHVVGLPPADYLVYKNCADKALAAAFNTTDPADVIEALEQVFAILSQAVALRENTLSEAGISEPLPEHVGTILTDDLLSTLICARWQGRRLTLEELLDAALAFFTGGAETTSSWILNCMYRLLEEPSRWQQLLQTPDLLANTMEESLRYDPPVLGLFRKNLTPTTLQGEALPEHSRLMYAIAAANRDPAVFSRADDFLLDRPLAESRKHISFGFGSHVCPGANLARLEAPIAISLLMERLPGIQRTGAVKRIGVFNYWGYCQFPISW